MDIMPKDVKMTNRGDTVPRIPWSVLFMGIGVLASVILNYAAYDTRISVLESTIISQEKLLNRVSTDQQQLFTRYNDLQVRIATIERDVINQSDVIKRLDSSVSDLTIQVAILASPSRNN